MRKASRIHLGAGLRIPRRKLRQQLLIVPFAFLPFCTAAVCQDREPADVIRVNTDLVVLDAQVIDKKSKRIIGDLSKEDFQINEDGVPQNLSYFSRDELPLSVMLMLDVSGSVRPIIHNVRDGALNALQRLKPDDQVAVMAFGTTSDLIQEFTKDRALVSRKIQEATATDRLGSGTFLGRALDSAALYMRKAPNPTSRRVIIIVTDNIAFVAGAEEKQILEELFDTGTVVYGLIVRAAIGKVFNVLFLGRIRGVNRFSEETGGEVLGADKNEVDAKLAAVIDRLRARYALGFRPTNPDDTGRFRRIVISVARNRNRKQQPVVITKKGYYLRPRT